MGWLQPIDSHWGIAILLLVAWVSWRLWRATRNRELVTGDDEVQIVFSVASLAAQSTQLDVAHVARAALCNAEVAAAFERRSVALLPVMARLDELGAEGSAPADGEGPAIAPALQEAVNAASAAAMGRGDAEFALSDLMTAMKNGSSPVADYLTQLGVVFDDTWIATTFGERGREAFVYVWNDDASPMEKVVEVLRRVFGEDELRASYLMMSVHLRGFVALGPFGPREADDLMDEANARAQELAIPLQVRREPPNTRDWRRTEHHGLLP